MIRHERSQFGRMPELGRNASICYKEQQAQLDMVVVAKRRRGVVP